jgi:carboxypeptidase C (cathepsin A)
LQGEARKSVIQKLSRYTGLTPEYLERAYLRVSVIQFMKELLRDQNLLVGRFDGRYTGYGFDSCGKWGEYDPSLDDVAPAFTATFNEYIRKDLKWEKDESYNILVNVRPWNFKASNSYLNTAENLREVMMKAPLMKVFVASGYFDLATPYLTANYTFDHMNLEPPLQRNIDKKYYNAGHMMYLHPQTLQKLKSDLTNFFNSKTK